MPISLAEREKDYFKGLSGSYGLEEVNKGGVSFIAVSLQQPDKRLLTEEQRQLSAVLLRRTIGTEGIVNGEAGEKGFNVFLRLDEFGYLLDPVGSDILGDGGKFDEYAEGFLHGELIPTRRSFASRDQERINQMQSLVERMGFYHGKGKKIGSFRIVNGKGVVDFRNPTNAVRLLEERGSDNRLLHISVAERIFAEYMDKRLVEDPVAALVTAAK